MCISMKTTHWLTRFFTSSISKSAISFCFSCADIQMMLIVYTTKRGLYKCLSQWWKKNYSQFWCELKNLNWFNTIQFNSILAHFLIDKTFFLSQLFWFEQKLKLIAKIQRWVPQILTKQTRYQQFFKVKNIVMFIEQVSMEYWFKWHDSCHKFTT